MKFIKGVALVTPFLFLLTFCSPKEAVVVSVEQKALDFFTDSVVYKKVYDPNDRGDNKIHIPLRDIEQDWMDIAMFNGYSLVSDGVVRGLTYTISEQELEALGPKMKERTRQELKGYIEYRKAHANDTTVMKLELKDPIEYLDKSKLELSQVYPHLDPGPKTLFVSVSKKVVSFTSQMVDIEIERWRNDRRQLIRFTVEFTSDGTLTGCAMSVMDVFGDI